MTSDGIEHARIMAHLERLLASPSFCQAERAAGLLRYLVASALDGGADRLKEYTVGVEALGRSTNFDPRTDPIVRAEASRLRGRLERYYAADGQSDEVVIELPKGTYTPRFRVRPAAPAVVREDGRAGDQTPQRLNHPLLAGIVATLLLALAGAGGVVIGRSGSTLPAPDPAMRLDVQLQTDDRIGSDVGTSVVLAPDGSHVVFVSLDSLGIGHLRLRRLDGSAPIDLPGTVGARGPFWSPDSRWIGFWSARQLRKISIDGGSPTVLCDASDLLGASWSDDGTIIAALDDTKRLWRVDAMSGGTPVPIVDLTTARVTPRWPQVLNGGTSVLYTAMTGVGVDQANIEVLSLEDGRRHVLVKGGTFGRSLGPHHLTYVNQGTLYAIRFDPSTLDTQGPPVPILDDVAYSPTFGFAEFSASRTGRAIYRRASPNASLIVARVDSVGQRTPLLDTPAQYAWPSLSPDGTRLAVTVIESGVTGLSMFTNLQARPQRAWNLTGYSAAVWSRDGQFLVASGKHGLAAITANGEPQRLITSGQIVVPWTFTPGDTRVAYAAMDSSTALDLWTAPLDRQGTTLRAGTPMPLRRSPSFETYPTISPDGRWLAYASNESGSFAVYVRALADSSALRVAPGARVPRWSRSSARLFFSTLDHRIMVVDYATTGGRFVASTPRSWTPLRLADTGVLPNYDVGRNDGEIVALLPTASPDAQSANHVTLISGLLDEVRRKSP